MPLERREGGTEGATWYFCARCNENEPRPAEMTIVSREYHDKVKEFLDGEV